MVVFLKHVRDFQGQWSCESRAHKHACGLGVERQKEDLFVQRLGGHQCLSANQWYLLADFPASKLKYLFARYESEQNPYQLLISQ